METNIQNWHGGWHFLKFGMGVHPLQTLAHRIPRSVFPPMPRAVGVVEKLGHLTGFNALGESSGWM